MATELPEPLRPYDGHPCAPLAAHLWADLHRIGIPVHLVDGLAPVAPVPDGVKMTLTESSVCMSWAKPDEGAPQDGSDQLAMVTHAAFILTNTLVGILSAQGYRVQTDPPEAHYGPAFSVDLDNPGTPLSGRQDFAEPRPELVPPPTAAKLMLDSLNED